MAPLTLARAFAAGVREEMQRDERVFVLGTDLYIRGGHFAQLYGLGEEFGHDRVRDTPISEAAMVAAGVGAALNGMHPIVDLNFIDFALGAMDEIVNQAAKIRYMWGLPVPVVIRGSAGIAGYAAQHNNSLESAFVHTPGLVVVAPSTPADTKGLIKTALRGDDPVIFLMHKRLTGARGEVGGADDLVPFGRAVTRRSGDDVTIVAWAAVVDTALQAAAVLEQEGVHCDVIDLRTLYPLDMAAIEASVRRTGRLVVVDEAPLFSGLGAEIAASIQEAVFDYLDGPVRRVGRRHAPVPHSPVLLEAMLPTAADVVAAARAFTRVATA